MRAPKALARRLPCARRRAVASIAQHAWTLFVSPPRHAPGASLAAVPVVPLVRGPPDAPVAAARISDRRRGPSPAAVDGRKPEDGGPGLGRARRRSGSPLRELRRLGGPGSGIIYVGVIGLVVFWFPDRPGFAGVAAAGYATGASLTTVPMASSVCEDGCGRAPAVCGIALGLAARRAAQRPRPRASQEVSRAGSSRGGGGDAEGVGVHLRDAAQADLFVPLGHDGHDPRAVS